MFWSSVPPTRRVVRLSTVSTFALAAVVTLWTAPLSAQAAGTSLTPIATDVYLSRGSAGNSVIAVTKAGVAIVGAQTAAGQPALAREIAAITHSPVRFVMLTAHPGIESDRDAGWSRAGATTIVEEHSGYRIGRGLRAEYGKNPVPVTAPGMPSLGFSEVQQIHLVDEDIHVVRQKPGNTDSDVSAHFEEAKVIYLGNALAVDGYPVVDAAHGGRLDGLIETSAKFMGWPGTKFVPGRGDVVTNVEVKAFHDMLVAVRDLVKAMKDKGQSLDAIIAAHPTAAYDAQWGRADGSAKALVTAAYHSLEPAAGK